MRAYALQEQGHDTVDANRALGLPDDCRDFSMVKPILDDLGVRSISLLTNNPLKVEALAAQGVVVKERLPLVVAVTRQAARYLAAKAQRMGHLLGATDSSELPLASK